MVNRMTLYTDLFSGWPQNSNDGHELEEDRQSGISRESKYDGTLNEPLIGVWEYGRKTMDILADSVDTLERKVVPIIPFSLIRIDNSKYFSGGTARVYRGRLTAPQHLTPFKIRKTLSSKSSPYHTPPNISPKAAGEGTSGGSVPIPIPGAETEFIEDVAVKFLFCIELTPERVAEFVSEATLLNSVQHPNIITCMGVSVMPPAICLVTEYCLYGSLYDLLHSSDFIISEKVAQSDNKGSKPGTPTGNRKRNQTASPTMMRMSSGSRIDLVHKEGVGNDDDDQEDGDDEECGGGGNPQRYSSYSLEPRAHMKKMQEVSPLLPYFLEYSIVTIPCDDG